MIDCIIGIDLGSRNTKLSVVDTATRAPLYQRLSTTDVSPKRSLDLMLEELTGQLGIHLQSSQIAVTGYGRHLVRDAGFIFSEICCHAAGVLNQLPDASLIIDIGGQDSKILAIDSASFKVRDFIMNDKCAAGTGRFLEMTAIRLNVNVSELSSLAKKADEEHSLSSTCIVFAESEIIGLMAHGVSSASIARAVHRSIAKRIHAQMSPFPVTGKVAFTGGLAHSEDLCNCLSEAIGSEVHGVVNPDYTGATGAALLAISKLEQF